MVSILGLAVILNFGKFIDNEHTGILKVWVKCSKIGELGGWNIWQNVNPNFEEWVKTTETKFFFVDNGNTFYPIVLVVADTRKTFGPLPDRRTGNHKENPRFIGARNLLGLLIFFNITVLIEGLHTGFFLTDRRTCTIRVFIGPPLFLPVEDPGPVDFPMSGCLLTEYV